MKNRRFLIPGGPSERGIRMDPGRPGSDIAAFVLFAAAFAMPCNDAFYSGGGDF